MKTIAYFVTFDDLTLEQQLDALNRGFAPAIPLYIQECDWYLKYNEDGRTLVLRPKWPKQGFGSAEPECFNPWYKEELEATLNEWLDADLKEYERMNEY